MSHEGVQLPLNVRLPNQATFDTYVEGPNREALRAVRTLGKGEGGGQVYLWGSAGTGKSHLLQALCRVLTDRGHTSVYFPLVRLAELGPGILEGLDGLDLICIDDLDVVVGQADWERALFVAINRCREAGRSLAFGARSNPAQIPVNLPDLSSRFAWGPVFRLRPLDDNGKVAALSAHAAQRGLHLSEEVGRYLLTRCSRDLTDLLGLLDALDTVSLATQRRITIPLIRSVLAGGDFPSIVSLP